MSPALIEACAFQAKACEGLGSPFMARILPRLLGLIDPRSALAERLRAWPSDRLGPSEDSVPLRLAGALHHLHLTGAAPALSAAYPPNRVDDVTLETAIETTFASCEAAVLAFLDSPPQTNEVRRAAVLIAAGHWLTARFGKPLRVSEIGASAGLNLSWDFFRLDAAGRTLGSHGSKLRLAPDWDGVPPVVCPAYVAEARGVDLNPIDVSDPEQALRLQAYLWPDQQDRLARTKAAIDLYLQPDTEAQLDAGDALDWLPGRLPRLAGHTHMIYSTIAWQYLPPGAQAKGEAMITAAGDLATMETPLAWFRMEPDGQGRGAGLTMQVWPGSERFDFGRVDFHGRWVEWRAPEP